MKNVLIVGSLNMDLVIQTPVLPKLGETLKGTGFMTACGGKGANQAIAVGKILGRADMIGAVGRDSFGKTMRENLEANGVSAEGVTVVDGNSGIAMITVCNGDNHILLDGGANDKLTPSLIDMHKDLFRKADIVILQLEIPMETVLYAAKTAKACGAKVLLNPAPAAKFSEELLRMADILIPNEHEAAALTGEADPQKALLHLAAQTGGQVIVTLGDKGCIYNQNGAVCRQPAFPAKTVDTTAAGDSFIGALCAAMCEDMPLNKAIAFAASVSAVTVSRMGAAVSIPTRAELAELL